jgi:hypothetical protein
MTSLLSTVPKVRGFKLGRGRLISKNDKIRSTPYFEGEVKPSAPCRKIFTAC